MPRSPNGFLPEMPAVPVIAVRASLPLYAGAPLSWPPGWCGLWPRAHALPTPAINLTGIVELP
jgi:hypothetical protein